MVKPDIFKLMNLLRLENIRDGGDWVRSSCPFAAITHEKGTDEHPSFGVSVGDHSRYFCFTCQTKGQLAFLPSAMSFLYKKDYKEARTFIFASDSFSFPAYEEKEKGTPEDIYPMQESVLQSFAKLPKHIQQSLDMTEDTVKKYQICYDKPSQRVIFPIRNKNKELVGVRGRYFGLENKAKYMSYTSMHPKMQDAKSFGIWYLMHEPLAEDAPLVLVEGERDALSLRQSGKINNAWAAMGAAISRAQINSLINLRNKVVLFFDNDNAGRLATEKIKKVLNQLTKVYTITNYSGCKDPAEICSQGKLNATLRSIQPI